MTNDLQRRMVEHRQGLVPGFTARYNIFRLVHCEQFAGVRDAIAREKEIKGWRREKKIRLIERDNPTWEDFAEQFAPPKKTDPSPGREDATEFGMTTVSGLGASEFGEDNAVEFAKKEKLTRLEGQASRPVYTT